MQKTKPSIPRDYLNRLHSESVAFVVGYNNFDLRGFQQDYYAPGGLRDQLGPGHFDRLYRVTDITTRTLTTGLPQMIDHHAGCAWEIMWSHAKRGYAPYHERGDSLRAVCDVVTRFPEGLRDRLDPVLEGLRKSVDPDGYYEDRFMDWSQQWYGAMQTAYHMSNSEPARVRYAARLRLCRQAAEELYPDLAEWFEDLRENVCGGGDDYAWRRGDELREKAVR